MAVFYRFKYFFELTVRGCLYVNKVGPQNSFLPKVPSLNEDKRLFPTPLQERRSTRPKRLLECLCGQDCVSSLKGDRPGTVDRLNLRPNHGKTHTEPLTPRLSVKRRSECFG